MCNDKIISLFNSPIDVLERVQKCTKGQTKTDSTVVGARGPGFSQKCLPVNALLSAGRSHLVLTRSEDFCPCL